MRIFNLGKAKAEPAKTPAAPKEKKDSRLSGQVNRPQPDRVQMELGNLRLNVESAKDANNPSWVELYRMYENTLTDAEVKTQRRIAVNKIKAEKFILSKDGKDDEELTALFEKPWFDKFRELLIDAELWGYRLIEFGQFDEDNQFIDCKGFPPMNVYPHNQNIIIEPTDTAGIPYSNFDPEKGDIINPYDFFLIEVGDRESIGLLEVLTREVIIKSFCRRDWNEHSEKWGQPRIVIKSDAEGKDMDAIENGARNFSRNGYAIVGLDEEVEKFEASSNGSGYLIYDKNIDKCDQYIAKIINGQYGTGAEKSFVGTAQVAERILDDFHHSRLREAQNIINYELIPFLIHWGYPLETVKGRFPSLDPVAVKSAEPDPNDPEEIDEDTDPGDDNTDPDVDKNDQGSSGGKKDPLKKKSAAKGTLVKPKKIVSANNADSVFADYVERVKQGTQVDLSKTRVDDPRFAMQVNLEADAARFATFREAQKERELSAAKTDLDKAKIEKRYKEYLATEKQAIFANSAAAERWAGFAENADLYPNLEWRTAGDDDVRDEHKKLDGIILPLNDPFWNTHTPPLDWGCRCELIQTDEPANQQSDKYKGFEETTAPKGFDFNPGIDQRLFSDSAGYYTSPTDAVYRELTTRAQELALSYFEKSVVKALKSATVKVKGVSIAFDEQGIKQTIEVNAAENKALAVNSIYDLQNLLKKLKYAKLTENGEVTHVWKNAEYLVHVKQTADKKAIFEYLKKLK